MYVIEWKNSAEKELRSLPRKEIKKIVSLVESLLINPFPTGAKKLTGTTHLWRLRSGDYRIVYSVESEKLIIQIVAVGHRQGIYKRQL